MGTTSQGPRTAGEAVAEEIRSQIATGQLRPGDMLPPERALLDRYGVAQPTMRGALRILESDGLISIERGTKGGARVTEPDVAPLARRVGLHLQLRGTDVRDLIQAEAVIQPGAAGLAALARGAEDVERLRSAVRAAAGAASVAEYLTALTEFTDALLHTAAQPHALALRRAHRHAPPGRARHLRATPCRSRSSGPTARGPGPRTSATRSWT